MNKENLNNATPSDNFILDISCNHEYDWIDDSFPHAFGVEERGHWECVVCGDTNCDSEPPHSRDYEADHTQ